MSLPDKVLTVRDVAKILQCSEKTVYSWAETGYADFPSYKLGPGNKSLLRIDPDRFEEWLQRWKDKAQSKNDKSSCYNDNAETVAKPRKEGD